MKKMLGVMLVLALCCIANATVEWQTPQQFFMPGQLVTLNIISTDTVSGLFSMDVVATIVESADYGTIVGAMSTDAWSYGWDYVNYPSNPIITPTSVEFGGTQFNVNYASVVGYIKVQFNSNYYGFDTDGYFGISLTNGYNLAAADVMDGATLNHLEVSDLWGTPEPATMALLCLGGLMIRRIK